MLTVENHLSNKKSTFSKPIKATPLALPITKMDPPVPGFVFSGGYYLLAAFTLSALSFLQQKMSGSTYQVDESNISTTTTLISQSEKIRLVYQNGIYRSKSPTTHVQ